MPLLALSSWDWMAISFNTGFAWISTTAGSGTSGTQQANILNVQWL